MRLSTNRYLAAAFAGAMLFTTVEGLASQARTAGSPEDPPAVTYRKAVMDGLVAHVVALRVLLGNDLPHQDHVRHHTTAVLDMAMMFDGLFAPGSTGGTTSASEEIWANSEEFKAHIKTFQGAARALDANAAVGERSVTMPFLDMVVQTCGGCHTEFRLPTPFPEE